jgi:hypothetical protein
VTRRKATVVGVAAIVVLGGIYSWGNRPTKPSQNSEIETSAVNSLVTQLASTSVIKDLQVASFTATNGNLNVVQAANLTISEKATIGEVAALKLSSESIVTNSTQTGTLSVSGASIFRNVSMTGLNASSVATPQATVGSLNVANDAHILGSATIAGNTAIGGNTTINGAAIIAGNTSLQGNVTVDDNLQVSGSTTVAALSANATTLNSLSVTTTAAITGGASVGGNFTVGTDKFAVDTTSGKVGVNNNAPASQFHVKSSATDSITAIMQAAASQTADIFQIRNSDNSILARFTNDGALNIESTSPSYFAGGVSIGLTDNWAPLHVAIGQGAASDIATYVEGYGANGQLAQVVDNYASGGTAWYILATADGSQWGPEKYLWYDATSGTTPLVIHGASGKISINGYDEPTNTLGVNGTIGASGSITANSTPDLAETINAAADVEAADVVSANPNKTESVIKSSGVYDPAVVGVISDGSSAFMINAYGHSESAPLTGKPLVLAGRVPVKVTNEGGTIRPGDYLTASSTPGKAMKATKAGPTIGKALGSFNGTEGTVLALINVSYADPNALALQGQQEGNFTALNVSGKTTLSKLTVTGDVSIAGILKVTGHIVSNGSASTASTAPAAGTDATVTIDGNDTAGTITIVTGENPSEGALAAIQYRQSYNKNPKVSLTPGNREASQLHYYRTSTVNELFIESSNAPQAYTTYIFDYQVIE